MELIENEYKKQLEKDAADRTTPCIKHWGLCGMPSASLVGKVFIS